MRFSSFMVKQITPKKQREYFSEMEKMGYRCVNYLQGAFSAESVKERDRQHRGYFESRRKLMDYYNLGGVVAQEVSRTMSRLDLLAMGMALSTIPNPPD